MVLPADLARMALFAGFTDEDRALVAAYMVPGDYRRGELIFRQGDPGTSLYVIEAGQVKIRVLSPVGRELVLAILEAGEFFGELAILDGQPRSADAVAMQPTRLLVLQRQDLRRDLEARPRIAVELLSVLSRRLRQADGIIQDAAFLDLAGRLAKVLLGLAESHGQPRADGMHITIRLTQAELAAMVGSTRESVSKWLGSFERSGLIRRGGGRITVVEPDLLRARIT